MPHALSPSIDVASSTLVCVVIGRLESEPETPRQIEALSHLRKALGWLGKRDTIEVEERGD